MFKKLILSLILAGSTLSYGQSLRTQINRKGLQGQIEATLNVLSDQQLFRYTSETNFLGNTTVNLFSIVSEKPEALITDDKNTIKAAYSDMETAIAGSLTNSEKEVLRNYLNNSADNFVYVDNDDTVYTRQNGNTFVSQSGQKINVENSGKVFVLGANNSRTEAAEGAYKKVMRFYNDDFVIDYVKNNLKTKYIPLYNALDPTGTTIYNLTPCYPYSENSSVTVNNAPYSGSGSIDYDCTSKYGDKAESLEKKTEELFYALTLSTFLTSVPGCTKYSEQRIQSGQIARSEYDDNYLVRVGSELRLLPYQATVQFNAYSVLDVFNVNFSHALLNDKAKKEKRDATRDLIADCDRVNDLIEEHIY